jgi:glyoxylase-like metal-dependent hydrolase (beta-lactamase superfamily II)
VAFIPVLLKAHNPGPMTGTGNNTYLIFAGRDATLIDAGTGEPGHLAALAAELQNRGATLTQVLVTHAHADHASGAPALASAHPAARFFKYPWPGEDAKFPVDWQPIAEGARFDVGDGELVALHTPGHSPDHVVFWHEPTATILTGDLVVAGSSVMIHFSKGGDLGQYLAALRRLLALAPARLLPAHGQRITDPAALLQGYLDHRALRERQVIEAVAAGLATVEAITESIYDGLHSALIPAARENVRAHLEKLRAEGRAAFENDLWTTSSTTSTSTGNDTSTS